MSKGDGMGLTDDQKRLQQEIRAFAEENFRAGMMRHSREPAFPLEAYRLVAREGYLGYMMPPEYGGAGNGVVEYCILMEELARVDHNIPWVIDVTFAVSSVIARLGTEEQKQRHLPRLIDGSVIPAFALTDLTGGSNVRAMGTAAERNGDGTWTISGRKAHIHNCDHAGLWLVFASTPDGADAILVENPENVRLERRYQPFGFRCAPCFQLYFDGTPADDSGFLGERGKGVMAALAGALNYTRIGNASIVIGIASAAMDVALSFAMGRQLKQGFVSDQQAVQHMIADMATDLDAASLLRWRAAQMHDRGENPVKEASQAKVFATEHATQITGAVLRLLGAYGTYEELPLSDYFTSCKTLELASGASEIHRNNIAREVMRAYDKRFDTGDLLAWAQSDEQEALLRLNERSDQVLDRA
jgi:alkylation response protein AidB-like acyl-CoA dehydrogenase